MNININTQKKFMRINLYKWVSERNDTTDDRLNAQQNLCL